MLPENEALRRAHAPLAEFVAGACKRPLLFKPGTQVKYQSMGLLLAAEIVERITGTRLRDFLHKEVFDPLRMAQTSLGLGGRAIASTALCQVSGNDDWNWNSPYWLNLGAPWGGAHASAADVAKFCRAFCRPPSGTLMLTSAASLLKIQPRGRNDHWRLSWNAMPSDSG